MAANQQSHGNMTESKRFVSAARIPKNATKRETTNTDKLEDMRVLGMTNKAVSRGVSSRKREESLHPARFAPRKVRDTLPRIQTERGISRKVTSVKAGKKEEAAPSEENAIACCISGVEKVRSLQPVVGTRSLRSCAREARKKAVGQKSRAVVPMQKYAIKPIIPAKTAEILDVARAMHRDQFASRVKQLFDPEREAAMQAIESGLYVGWRCPGNNFDCIRVSVESRCFCGHALKEHESFSEKRRQNLICLSSSCPCKQFAFVPSRPEDVGEWWLPKRRGFNVTSWRAKCRCKHDHEQHNPNKNRKCEVKSCSCFAFDSNFLCAACNQHWESHDTCFDDLNLRQQKGLPYGKGYLPFNELPNLRNIVLTGNEDDSSSYDALASGPYAIPTIHPTELSLKLQGKRC